MPYKNEGRSNYPKGTYLKPENIADSKWLSLKKPVGNNTMVMKIESIDAFNSFYPMEICATSKELTALILKSSNKAYLVFTEDRIYPIRMKSLLPYRWIKKGITNSFKGIAAKGEFYNYQLGIYAIKPIQHLQVQFTDLKDAAGNTIATKYISCINTNGIDYAAKVFTKTIDVQQGDVQALWCGVEVPLSTHAGIYKGKATIKGRKRNINFNRHCTYNSR